MLRVVATVFLVGCVGSAAPAPKSGPPIENVPMTASSAVTYQSPVGSPLRVVRPFIAPLGRFGAGHRGVDLGVRDGQPVGAAGAGTVSFAGQVAGRGVVVIQHPDGVRTEYEPVTVKVRSGTVVSTGQEIAVVHGAHGSCSVGACLHWSARRGEAYFDPLTLLRPLGIVRLLPG